jgi:hypothetical protein
VAIYLEFKSICMLIHERNPPAYIKLKEAYKTQPP